VCDGDCAHIVHADADEEGIEVAWLVDDSVVIDFAVLEPTVRMPYRSPLLTVFSDTCAS
jgi:hypothetical protein